MNSSPPEAEPPPPPTARAARRARRWTFPLAAAALGTLIALALGEAGLRVAEVVAGRRAAASRSGDPDAARTDEFFRASATIHRRSADPKLVYELAPNTRAIREGVEIVVNADGWRDDPFPSLDARRGDPERRPRVVVLGDSVAWGWGVEMAEAFPQRLEAMLAERFPARPPVVLNLAVDGYSTEQQIRQLETRVPEYDPDLIVLCYVMNDPDTDDGGLSRHYARPALRLARPIRSALWNLTNPDNKSGAADAGRDYFQYVHERYWSRVDRQFARLGELSRELGAPLLVAVSPVLAFEPGGTYHWEYLHEHLREACAANGLAFLDLREAFAGLSSREICNWLDAPGEPGGKAPDVLHPNARGHEAIAATLAERLAAREEIAGGSGDGGP